MPMNMRSSSRGKIHELIKIAREENDYNTEPLLAWFSNEQIEEEASTDKIARQLEMIGDNKQDIFLCDQELATRVFIQGSPLGSVAYRQAT